MGFLTDYGLEDGFVAACHGVIAAVAPEVRIIDITHLVPPGEVRRGAAVLAQTVPYLPAKVHVAVVDPGVGTTRRAVAVTAGEAVLVGPDNGLLLPAAEALGGVKAARELTNAGLWRHPVSATFHGRDIFCPVGAWLARGGPIADVGPEVDPSGLVRLAPPAFDVDAGTVTAEVVTVDRFGNVQLGGPAPPWQLGATLVVEAGGRRWPAPYADTFAAADPGQLVVFTDSAGMLAIAVNGGRAADRLGVAPGSAVRLSTHQ